MFRVRCLVYTALLVALRIAIYWRVIGLYGNADPYATPIAIAVVIAAPILIGVVVWRTETPRSDRLRRRRTTSVFVGLTLPFPWELLIAAVLAGGSQLSFD